MRLFTARLRWAGVMGPARAKRHSNSGPAVEAPATKSGARKLVAFDDAARRRGAPHRRVVGVDEAGRGPLVGPVVAAAFCLTDQSAEMPAALDDSKKVPAATRSAILRELFALEASGKASIGVALAGPREIDRDNILASTLRAMERALRVFMSELGPDDLILVDGIHVPEGLLGDDDRAEVLRKREVRAMAARRKLERQGLPTDDAALGEIILPPPLVPDPGRRPSVQSVTKGDATSAAIAAASVIAKETRDALMREMDGRFPGYGIAGHQGYPTAEHRSQLQSLGPSLAHRRTFQPLKSDFGWDWQGQWAPQAKAIDGFHEYEWGESIGWNAARLRGVAEASCAEGGTESEEPEPPAQAPRQK